MAITIGFYIRHCDINIAHRVRVTEVAAYARGLKNVAVSRDYKFMCSDPGQEMIENDIRTYGLNRVVVASCSPRLHEKTFQNACQRAGLNPYLFQMASVREQVSWVTSDEDEATRKAKTLAAGAINRVNFHQMLEKRSVSVHPDVMVVGGGIAGMQAALVNILENAMDACLKNHRMPTHQIDFSITEHGDDIVFCIADDGIGMDKDSTNRIFSLFYSTKGRKGTGLGLFIANRVVGQHGGRITVASKPGEGSVFRVRIPKHPPEMKPEPAIPTVQKKQTAW